MHKDALPGLIMKAFRSSMTDDVITAGFRKTGICPFKRLDFVIEKPELAPTEKKAKITRKERKDNRECRMLFETKEVRYTVSFQIYYLLH